MIAGVVDRALLLLRLLGREDSLTAAELSRRSGLPATTVRRLMSDLLGAKAVTRLDGAYRITDSIVDDLVHAGRECHATIAAGLGPFVLELHLRTNLVVYAAVLDRGQIDVVGSAFDHHHQPSVRRLAGAVTGEDPIVLALLSGVPSGVTQLPGVRLRQQVDGPGGNHVAIAPGPTFVAAAPVRMPQPVEAGALCVEGGYGLGRAERERYAAVLRQVALAASRHLRHLDLSGRGRSEEVRHGHRETGSDSVPAAGHQS
ncbi:MAG: helix-turn-helix domain-containing protein [Actinophytocola sp.]|uniref:helix-turn-helix domain-containing protein n=1 Tax=Actinophytocola sp. TaxID=1872138 RepID=UPI003C783089